MNKIYKKATAKLNLTLNILDKREDGYHNLESVFQKINLYDEIYIEKTNTNKIDFICSIKELENKHNIIYKAYNLLKERDSSISGVKVTLIKHIPCGAGLGGGSTDCASFLLLMNTLFSLDYSKQDLISIGKQLGADVPSCLHSNSMLVKGIGEIITPIDSNMKYYIVLVKPEISFDTKLMYNKIDNHSEFIQEYNSQNVIKALQTNDIELLCSNLYNVFEEVLEKSSEIQKIKKLLTDNGALSSLMTGSGSCVFGIFSDKVSSKKSYDSIKNLYESYWCIANNKKGCV